MGNKVGDANGELGVQVDAEAVPDFHAQLTTAHFDLDTKLVFEHVNLVRELPHLVEPVAILVRAFHANSYPAFVRFGCFRETQAAKQRCC
jgi:hypothetical protein